MIDDMNPLFVAFILSVFGLFLGSFAGAMIWRLRSMQLREDKKAGEKVRADDRKQVEKLKKSSVMSDRSICLHCGHQLKWYDLIPLVSWVYLNGRCRYCNKPIGSFEPLMEIAMAAFFAVSFLLWPLPLETAFDIARLALWLVAGVGLLIVAGYDMKWFLLPNRIVFPLIGLGLINALIVLAQDGFTITALSNVVYACAILSGLYYLIYVFSRHQWIGFGDVKLGLALALFLADWRLAALALFFANAIGTLLVLPMMLVGRINRGAHIPFGPLLIAGWFIAGLLGQRIIEWYLSLLGVS